MSVSIVWSGAIGRTALERRASMFRIGATVVNFGQVARVVGLFASADGQPCAETGWPILRRLDRAGRPNGGKWLADPAKCTAAPATAPTVCHFGECGQRRCTGCGTRVQVQS